MIGASRRRMLVMRSVVVTAAVSASVFYSRSCGSRSNCHCCHRSSRTHTEARADYRDSPAQMTEFYKAQSALCSRVELLQPAS